MARSPGSASRRASSKTSLTSPMPFSSRSGSPSLDDDARGLLAAVLQRVQAEVGEVGGLGVAEDPEQPALVVEVVVVDGGAAPGRLALGHGAILADMLRESLCILRHRLPRRKTHALESPHPDDGMRTGGRRACPGDRPLGVGGPGAGDDTRAGTTNELMHGAVQSNHDFDGPGDLDWAIVKVQRHHSYEVRVSGGTAVWYGFVVPPAPICTVCGTLQVVTASGGRYRGRKPGLGLGWRRLVRGQRTVGCDFRRAALRARQQRRPGGRELRPRVPRYHLPAAALQQRGHAGDRPARPEHLDNRDRRGGPLLFGRGRPAALGAAPAAARRHQPGPEYGRHPRPARHVGPRARSCTARRTARSRARRSRWIRRPVSRSTRRSSRSRTNARTRARAGSPRSRARRASRPALAVPAAAPRTRGRGGRARPRRTAASPRGRSSRAGRRRG